VGSRYSEAVKKSDAGLVRQMNLRSSLSWMFFGLMIAFILTYTIGYTLDIRYHTNTVVWLTASRIALLFVATVYVWTVRRNLPYLFDALSLTAGGIILVGAISGLFNRSDWTSYLRHGFQYSCLLAFYLAGRDLACRKISKAAFIVIFIAILAGYTMATVLYAATPGLHSGSYSFQPNLALLPLAYNGGAVMSAACAILILIGNKRAVFVGACFCVAALITLFMMKSRGGSSLPIRTSSTFAMALMIGVAVTSILPSVQIPLLGMVATRISSSPSFIDTDTNSRLADPAPPDDDNKNMTVLQKEQVARQEAAVAPLVRWTSARNIEVEAVARLLNSRPIGALVGAGFGSQFEMDYISPNNYERVFYPREQADVMPAHIAMTSGWPLSIFFTIVLVVLLWRMFARLDALQHMDRTFALFSVSLFLDIMLGFNGTNALVWTSFGYATMRSLKPGIAST